MDHLLEVADNAFERLLLTNMDVQKAYAYADAAHSALDQRRKYTGAPYIQHPRMVAGILLTATSKPPFNDGFVAPIQAALLHDVLEDTAVTVDDMLRHFSGEVVDLVQELTEPDDPYHWMELGFTARPNRATRRAVEVERRAEISATAQTISVADIIANSHDIVAVAPHDFAQLYQRELSARLAVLDRADPTLWLTADQLLASNLTRLESAA